MRGLVRAAQRWVPSGGRGVTVFAYHLVDGGTTSPVDISSAHFRADLEWLARNADVVDLLDADPWSSGQVVLTFDDAYANFAEVVWPIVRAFGLPATLYVPTGFIDGAGPPIRDTTLGPCTWDQLGTMAEQGLSLGSHTTRHPDLRTVRDAMVLAEELVHSKERIEARTGAPCRSFCYPRALFGRAAHAVVETAYDAAVVGGGRRFVPGTSVHRIPRISIRNDHVGGQVASMTRQRFWLEEGLADAVRQLRP